MEAVKFFKVLDLKSGGISDSFSKECELTRLHLNGNQLQGNIPKSLMNCIWLQLLDLGDNEIDDVFFFFCVGKTRLTLTLLIQQIGDPL